MSGYVAATRAAKVTPARWPAAMKRNTAAEYLDMSVAAFEREVASRRLPPPFKLGGRDHWRKDVIDRAIEMLTGEWEEAVPEWEREFRAKYGGG